MNAIPGQLVRHGVRYRAISAIHVGVVVVYNVRGESGL